MLTCYGYIYIVAAGNMYQYHLLLNRHPASANISSAEYKKLKSLEDKLGYLLDELSRLQHKGEYCTCSYNSESSAA